MIFNEVDKEEAREPVVVCEGRLLLGAKDAPGEAERELLEEYLVRLFRLRRGDELAKVADEGAEDLEVDGRKASDVVCDDFRRDLNDLGANALRVKSAVLVVVRVDLLEKKSVRSGYWPK